jgi:hypothetical protein
MQADLGFLMVGAGLALGLALTAVALFERWNKTRP